MNEFESVAEIVDELDSKEQKLFDEYKQTKQTKIPDKRHIFILLKENGSLLSALAEDGELTLGKDVAITDAAKEFWKYVKDFMPSPKEEASNNLLQVKAQCFDLIQENKALKQKLALICSKTNI